MSTTRIKSTAVNNVAYTGIVTISQYTNGKKIATAKTHNAGGRALFNFLANCLTGDFDTAKANIPTKILLLAKNKDTGTLEPADPQFKYILTNPELVYSTNECIVKYSFIIPQERFTGTGFNAIGLYPSSATYTDTGNYVAVCDIDSSNFKLAIAMSTVLVLDWELHISNGQQH